MEQKTDIIESEYPTLSKTDINEAMNQAYSLIGIQDCTSSQKQSLVVQVVNAVLDTRGYKKTLSMLIMGGRDTRVDIFVMHLAIYIKYLLIYQTAVGGGKVNSPAFVIRESMSPMDVVARLERMRGIYGVNENLSEILSGIEDKPVHQWKLVNELIDKTMSKEELNKLLIG